MLKITVPADAGGAVHFHHEKVNAHPDHKHEVKKGSFSCDECGEAVRSAQESHPENYVDWKVE